jgi:hypothetical protein
MDGDLIPYLPVSVFFTKTGCTNQKRVPQFPIDSFIGVAEYRLNNFLL